jgi:hypothetical protein
MDSTAVPIALKDRLGPEATEGLLRVLEQVQTDLREDVITACHERFERRVVEEVSGLRVQIAQTESSIRQDMTRLGADLRQQIGAVRTELREEIGAVRTDLRREIGGLGTDLRQEIGGLGTDLRQEIAGVSSRMASDRFELLKWAFLFWIGQVVAIGTLFGVIMRISARS